MEHGGDGDSATQLKVVCSLHVGVPCVVPTPHEAMGKRTRTSSEQLEVGSLGVR